MGRFLLRRFISSIPVIIGILALVFALARMIPGDPCRAALGERATDEICNAYNERYGLNDPIYVQFAIYLGDVLTGDLGESFRFGVPVTDLLIQRLPTTIELAAAALFIAVTVGIPLGIVSAYRHNTKTDVATMIGANIGVAMPVFWLGLMLQYVFAVFLRDTPLALPPSGKLDAGLIPIPFYEAWGLPVNGFMEFLSEFTIMNALVTFQWEIFQSAFLHLILPALALATIPMAIVARMTRSSLLDVLGLDYIRTARAKGLRERLVVLKHGLLAGVGKTLFDAITSRDYTVVQGFTLVVAISFVVVNLIVDLIYTYLDPRVRVS